MESAYQVGRDFANFRVESDIYPFLTRRVCHLPISYETGLSHFFGNTSFFSSAVFVVLKTSSKHYYVPISYA
jgi:hypothetical protein